MNLISEKTIVVAFCLAGLSLSAAAQSNPAAPGASVVSFGLGVMQSPQYVWDSKHNHTLVPSLSWHDSTGFFLGTQEGIGYAAQLDKWTLSAALSYRGGREDKNDSWSLRGGGDKFNGVEGLGGALTTRLNGTYKFDNGLALSVGTELALKNRDSGNTVNLGLKAPLYSAPTERVSLELGALYGDRKFNRNTSYFANEQHAGFNQVTTSVVWDHAIDKKWSVTTRAGFTQLIGQAADDPFVSHKTNPLLMSAVNYSF